MALSWVCVCLSAFDGLSPQHNPPCGSLCGAWVHRLRTVVQSSWGPPEQLHLGEGDPRWEMADQVKKVGVGTVGRCLACRWKAGCVASTDLGEFRVGVLQS